MLGYPLMKNFGSHPLRNNYSNILKIGGLRLASLMANPLKHYSKASCRSFLHRGGTSPNMDGGIAQQSYVHLPHHPAQ